MISQRAGQVDANFFMVEKFNLYQVVVLLYRSKTKCVCRMEKGCSFFAEVILLPHPPKTQWYYTICELPKHMGKGSNLFCLSWSIVLFGQTKLKSKQEDQGGPKPLTWVSGCHCSNCLCCRNSV